MFKNSGYKRLYKILGTKKDMDLFHFPVEILRTILVLLLNSVRKKCRIKQWSTFRVVCKGFRDIMCTNEILSQIDIGQSYRKHDVTTMLFVEWAHSILNRREREQIEALKQCIDSDRVKIDPCIIICKQINDSRCIFNQIQDRFGLQEKVTMLIHIQCGQIRYKIDQQKGTIKIFQQKKRLLH